MSKKGHKRTSVDSYHKIETFTIFDLLHQTFLNNTAPNVRIIPCNIMLLKIDGVLKGLLISDLKYLLYHMSSKNNVSYHSVCPLCEYRFNKTISNSALSEHMLKCNGKGVSNFIFDDRSLTHRPASLTTIKPPFILCGDFETIRENKTMSVISYAINLMFLDIDTGIRDSDFNIMRYSFTIVCDYISYKNPFNTLPVELRMFYNDELQKIRDDIVDKVFNKEISLGGLCLIDIFILDIMARSFIKRIYYTNRSLRNVLKRSNKSYDEYKAMYQANNDKCYQCNLSIDYDYESHERGSYTTDSFKMIFRKYIFKEFANTLSIYRGLTREYETIFQTYLSMLLNYKRLSELSTYMPEEAISEFTTRLTDFNNLYKVEIPYSTFTTHIGYLTNYFVLHHHPFSGQILGPSHRICNLSQDISPKNIKTDVYFHNIGFDSLFFLNQIIPEVLEFFGERELSLIFNGSKLKYMFSENFSFKDSYSIFQCAASTLFSTFNSDSQEEIVKQCFLNLYSTFNDNMKEFGFEVLFSDFKVMCQGKGISLYDNVCKAVFESKTVFPSKYMYRSSLKEFAHSNDIDELYDIFKNLYDKYLFSERECGLLDFNDFYNMLDSELLGHAIRMITKTEETGKIYTVRHTSIPTSARSLIIYSSNVILRYLSTQSMYDIFRTTKIGGYSGVHVPISYNTEIFKKDLQIKSLDYSTVQVFVDACSLYPTTMVQHNYPTGPYKHVHIKDVKTTEETILYLQDKIDRFKRDSIDLDILVNYDIEFTHVDRFYTYSPVVVKKEIPLYYLSSYQRLMCRKKLRSGKFIYSGNKGESVFPTCFKHNKWGYFNQMKKEIELEYSVSNIRNYILMVCGSFLTDEINKIVKIRQDPNVKPAISMMAKLKANSASGVFGMESERKQKTKVLYDPVLSDDKKAKVSDIKAYYSPLTINDDIVSEAIIDNRKRKQMGSHFCSMYDEVPFDVRVDDRITRSNVKRLKIWNDCAEKSVFKGFVEEIPLNCKVKSLIPINTKILAESKINVGLFYKRIFDDFKKCGVTVFNCYTDTDSLKMMFYRDGDSNNNDFLNFVLDKLKADYADKIDFSNIKKHPHYDGRFKKNLGFWQHENGSDTNGYNTIQSLVATAPKSYHVVYLNKSIERKAKGVKAAVDIPIKHYLDNFVDVSCYYNAIKSDSDLSNEKPENSNEKDYSLNDKIESHHNKLSLCHENIVSNQKNMKTNRISQHQFKNSLTADIKIQEIEKKTFASITNKTYRLGKRGELSIIHGHPILKDIMQYLKSLNSDELFSDETIRKQYLMEQDMINNSSYLTKWVKFFSEYTSSFIGYHTDEDDVTIRLSEQYARDLESDGE